jgi:hypothetical protein
MAEPLTTFPYGEATVGWLAMADARSTENVVRGHGERMHGVGARCLTTRRIRFAERPVSSEVAHVDPPRTGGFCGIDGPIRALINGT